MTWDLDTSIAQYECDNNEQDKLGTMGLMNKAWPITPLNGALH
jgi:hypothetical protein